TKNIKETLREWFFLNPTAKMRVRQIERELKLPLPSVIRYCRALEKEGVLKTTEIGNVVFYSADRSSEIFLLEKKLFNIRQLYKSGLVNYVKSEFHNPVTIVFGSYAKGEDTEGSDIDLYVETLSGKNISLNKFEKALKRKIQVFAYNNISKIQNIHLANNIINGFVLNGFLEVFHERGVVG
ncbi:MAG: nucleotidyltransferase domain-containing protein, partial [DPANN group archaeon]|nr:nucleotidyltransferase domain-containing protein [DPANN group archaeon]